MGHIYHPNRFGYLGYLGVVGCFFAFRGLPVFMDIFVLFSPYFTQPTCMLLDLWYLMCMKVGTSQPRKPRIHEQRKTIMKTKNTTEMRNEMEQAERVKATTEAKQAEQARTANTAQTAILEQIAVTDAHIDRLDTDGASLAEMVWEFLSEGLHKVLGMKSMKDVAQQWGGENSIVSSDSSLRDLKDLGAVRDACKGLENIETPVKLQAGRILKTGLKHADLATSDEFAQRMRKFTEARQSKPEIASAKAALTEGTVDAYFKSLEADAANKVAESGKTELEKATSDRANMIRHIGKIEDVEVRKAFIKDTRAMLTESNKG